ncbi:MAG: asparaginase [Alphaproteobacteria bacterium]
MALAHAAAPTGVAPIVEVLRGGVVESRHFGAAAVVAADGHVVGAWGDIQQPVFPRSAIKPMQALPLLESGAADAFDLDAREIAIACASHCGSAGHVRTVAAMLGRVGLDAAALACGARTPSDRDEVRRLAHGDEEPGRAHNGCSGKHAGMILVARHLGAAWQGYHRIEHPVQQRVVGTLEQMTGLDLFGAARAIDGCSLPIWALPLGNLALAMARLADPVDLSEARQAAIDRIWQAQASAPEMVDGPGGFVTEALRLGEGRLLVKNGAEGVHVASLREEGLGIAVKIADGGDRAAQVAIAALVLRYGEPGRAVRAHLRAAAGPPVLTWAGEKAGAIRPAEGWLARRGRRS